VHNVSQWPNLRHLGEPLGGAEGLPEAVSFKKAAESMSRAQRKSRECQMAGSEFQTVAPATLSVLVAYTTHLKT